ncbi:MAG: hypothetical protein ETSY1_10620 [Candidatus Entotheonella factor]|uniref:IPT/TIG domain-containing protein n=1 Tax=Entotheonella factor TaxID=1429438 RepID=W4LRA8_ENTF1|nr:MAG: hypothetical protein ETSY1_10620 [Candidatus Entotheonella factor]
MEGEAQMMTDGTAQRIGAWWANIGNIATVLAIVVVVVELFRSKPNIFIFVTSFLFLLFMVLLRYADIDRFKDIHGTKNEIPPLGLARGSVRAILAFGFLLGMGAYIYATLTIKGSFDPQVFTAISSIISAVVGFYFGSRSSSSAEPDSRAEPPIVTDIQPKQGISGKTVQISDLLGSGFQADATVSLVKDDDKIPADSVHVIRNTKITCVFNIPAGKSDKWDVIVTNPDGQIGRLAGIFEIN